MSLIDEILADRKSGSLDRSVSPLQGSGEEPQSEDSSSNTGVGATIGSLFGAGTSMLPFVPKNPVVIEALSAGGAFVGDLAESLIQRPLSGIDDRALDSANKEAATSALFGAAGTTVGIGFRRGAQYFQRSVTPEARDAIEFLRGFRPDETFATASEATENRALDFINNFAEHSVWGGGDVRAFKLHRDEVLSEISSDIANAIASKKSNIHIGKMIQNIRKHGKAIGQIEPQNMYKILEKESRNIPVSTDSLKKWSQQFAEENKAIGRFGQDLTGKGLAEKVMRFKDTMTVGDMIAFQRAIRAKIRSLESAVETNKAPAIKFYGDMLDQVDKIVDKGLRQPGSSLDLYAMKKEADRLWASNSEKFSNDIIKNLISDLAKDPTTATKHLVMGGEGTELTIRALKRIMPEKAWNTIQRGSLETLYRSATNKDGMMVGKDLLALMIGKNGIGERSMKELFGAEGSQVAIRFAKSLAELQKKTPISEGSLAIQFTQMGAVLATGTGQFKKEAAGLLIGPKIMAKLITSPKAVDALLKGAALTKSDPRWPGVLSRITGIMAAAQTSRREEEFKSAFDDILKGDPVLRGL